VGTGTLRKNASVTLSESCITHVTACDVNIHKNTKHPTGITSEEWITELRDVEKFSMSRYQQNI
jgi:hypothetical protein